MTIVGYGRFGKLFAELAKNEFDVSILESGSEAAERAKDDGFDVISEEHLKGAHFIVLAVPISSFEEVCQSLSMHINGGQVILDVCSVKSVPLEIMKRYFSDSEILGTHPMFGPDSAESGIEGLKVALCPDTISEINMSMINSFWTNLGVKPVITSADQHDKDAAYSQAFSYVVADILLGAKLPNIEFETRSYGLLNEVARLSANDSVQLFSDMITYNPYAAGALNNLYSAIHQTKLKLKK